MTGQPVSGLKIIETDAGLVADAEEHVSGTATGDYVLSLSAQSGSANTILYDTDLGEWPARPSDDPTVCFMWVGPTFPDVDGTGNFISNIDVYIPDAEVPGGGPAANMGVIVWDGTGEVPARPSEYNSVGWVTFDVADDPAANVQDGDFWLYPA